MIGRGLRVALGALLILARPAAGAEPEYRETILSVFVNGAPVAPDAVLLARDGVDLNALLADLRAWRLDPPVAAAFVYEGEEFVPLEAFPGLTYRVDIAALELFIDAPPDAFDLTVIDGRQPRILPRSGIGAFLNYDLMVNTGIDQDTTFSGFMEGVVFDSDELGVLDNDFIVNADGEGAQVTRLTSTWFKDLVERRESIRVGDAVTVPSILGAPVRFGGIQWARNFTLDPSFVRTPPRYVESEADGPSVVEIFVNDILRSRRTVPEGPFLLDVPTGATGQQDVEIVVTDPLGRELVVTESFFFSPENLAAGVSDFSVQAGFERENFGSESFDYGDRFGSATYRYGFTDDLTAGGHVEVGEQVQVLGASGVLALSGIGEINAWVLGSSSDIGTGTRQGFTYTNSNTTYNFGLSAEYTTENFRQLGFDLDSVPPKWSSRARFGVNLGRFGNASVSAAYVRNRTADDRAVLFGGYTVNLGFGTLLVDAGRSFKPEETFIGTVRLVVPLARDHTVTTVFNKDEDSFRGSIDYRKQLGYSEIGVGYRLRGDKGEDFQRYDGGLIWQTEDNAFTVNVNGDESSFNARVGASGAIGLFEDDVFLSRRVDGGFAMVDANGVEDVTVYLSNRTVGKTGSDGRLFVPNLTPYYSNTLRLESSEIPFDATIDNLEVIAVPYDRSGILAVFPIAITRSITLTVVDEAGEPLPSGAVLRSDDGTVSASVARGGFTYLTGLGEGATGFVADIPGQTCRFTLDIPEDVSLVPDLGVVACR